MSNLRLRCKRWLLPFVTMLQMGCVQPHSRHDPRNRESGPRPPAASKAEDVPELEIDLTPVENYLRFLVQREVYQVLRTELKEGGSRGREGGRARGDRREIEGSW